MQGKSLDVTDFIKIWKVFDKKIFAKLILEYLVSSEETCKLYCRADGTSNYYLLDTSVVDGTVCTPGNTFIVLLVLQVIIIL